MHNSGERFSVGPATSSFYELEPELAPIAITQDELRSKVSESLRSSGRTGLALLLREMFTTSIFLSFSRAAALPAE